MFLERILDMKTRFLIYLICCLLGGPQLWAASGYQFRHLSTGPQLSSRLINVIFQDGGFVYFGTASGLDRYDGYSVKSFTRDDADTTALHDNYIEDLQRATDGRVWVQAGGKYAIFDPVLERFCSDMAGVYASMGMSVEPDVVTFASDGSCWMFVEGEGLFRYNGENTVAIPDPDGMFRKAQVSELAETAQGRMLYVDRAGNMAFVDMRSARICAVNKVPGSGSDRVYTAYTDREGLLWVFSVAGLWIYNGATASWADTFGGVQLPQGHVMAVLQDSSGRMWIGFDHDGIAVLEKNGDMHKVDSDLRDDRTLSSRTVTALMEDRTGSIWVGSRKNGVSIYNDIAFKFDFTPYPDVNCIAADGSDRLWLGTDCNGLISVDRATGARRDYDTSRPGRKPDAIVDVACDKNGTVWAGTFGGGLLRIDAGGAVRHLGRADGLVCEDIWSVHPMADGRLMLATLGGGVQLYNPATGASTVYDTSNSGLASDYVTSIEAASDSLCYMATSDGLAVFDMARDEILTMHGNRRRTQAFDNSNINEVVLDSRGLLWVATREGLNVYDSRTDSIYAVRLGPVRRFVLGVAEDTNHDMWVSAGSELICVEVAPQGDAAWTFNCKVYDSSDGLQTCDFNQRSLCLLPDGEMTVGGFYGVNSFRPDAMKYGTVAPTVFFTGLTLFNEEVGVGHSYDGRVLLPRRVSDLDCIELSYKDNDFALSVATDDYVKPGNTVYYYRLDGFNDEWLQLPSGTHRISYTNLAPGHYTLHVKACSSDGVESANEASMGILIRPPFYATSAAKLVYTLLMLLLVFVAYRVVRSHERRLSHRRERLEAQRKQDELDQLKFRFFTNVSHELRTPLTLITAPLESLLKRNLDGETREKLEMIHGNAERLLMMVNQLLDFRKQEVTGMTLNTSRGDAVAFVRSICDSFLALSEKKHIHLTFFSSIDTLPMEFDADKMSKIIMNLLSNAFKFTPDNGRVDVSVSRVADNLEIAVADTGCGVSDSDKKRIFERFYQVNTNTESGGTGIGLSLVAEFVRLHGGTVNVADNGVRGAVFTVSIPCVRGDGEDVAADTERPSAGAGAPAEGEENSGMPCLLIVDDNADLLRFISSELEGEYAIITASDGAEALARIARRKPDVILSDLMMPGMDGIELCRRLKSDASTASIPLLILTAKHEVSAKIEGLTLGADDYMTKPFNIDVLRLRLSKLLSLREHGARRALIDPEPQSIAITSLDEKLIERAVRYVDEHMSSTDLSVEDLAAELGMSRVHLYKRLKQITGKTPIEFIRVLRLKRAAQLLRESQLNISEIAYRCGFNNPKYFSRHFKDEFGVLPSVYQEKEGK